MREKMVQIPVMETYLDTVEGYVQDEDKLVTYKWLSKELEVHVNLAKMILWNYWEKHKNKDQLVATFLLIGNLKTGGMRVEIVKDTKLDKAKEKFEKVISQHVYSLQKTLTDINLLAESGDGDSRYSSIKCEQSVVLTDEEYLKLRWGRASEIRPNVQNKIEKSVESKSNGVKIRPNIQNKIEKSVESKSKVETKMEVDDEPEKKVPSPSKQAHEKKGTASKKPVQSTNTGFNNLFGKAMNQQKKQDKKANEPSEKKSNTVTNASAKMEENKKSEAHKNKNEGSKEEKKSESSKNSSSSLPEESEKSQSSSSKSTKSASGKKSTKKSNSNARGKKRDRSESEGDTKKRKRIVVASDSSDDSAVASEDEDMFESPQVEEPVKVKSRSPTPPLVRTEGNKRKVRKLVDKTFVDDDGFLITKKEHVYVSCSDEEPEEEPKKPAAPDVPKEPKQNVKKKQASLMSFFKKS